MRGFAFIELLGRTHISELNIFTIVDKKISSYNRVIGA